MESRRKFLGQLGWGLGGLLTASAFQCQLITKKKPNIMFIVIEDLGINLGCYGKSYIKTPHMDQLAKEGIQFNRAYVNQPVCAASRASFLMGLRTHTCGVDYPYSYYFMEEIAPNHETLSQFFYNRGYFTRNFGKIHHGVELDEVSMPHLDGKASAYLHPDHLKLLKDGGKQSDLPPYEMVDLPENQFKDGQLAEAVVEGLKSWDKSSPFCFAVGFHKPHLTLSAPKKYWDLYNRDEIPLAENRYRPEGAPDMAYNRYNLHQYKWEHAEPKKLFSEKYERKLRHAYFACVSFIDAQIGKILKTLDEIGERENTIVSLVTDHGFHIGDLNNWGKTTMFEASLHIPMIISAPQMAKRNIKTDGLVEILDMYPTVIELSGHQVPEYMEGVSMVPLMKNPERDWKKAVFSRTPRDLLGRVRGLSMRTDQYRYTEWKDTLLDEVHERELYDLKKDPHQTKNIAHEPANKDLIVKLSKQLKAHWKGALPEGIENKSNNPKAPPAYAWGPEGRDRRSQWHKTYGGDESMGWRAATEMRLSKEAQIIKQCKAKKSGESLCL